MLTVSSSFHVEVAVLSRVVNGVAVMAEVYVGTSVSFVVVVISVFEFKFNYNCFWSNQIRAVDVAPGTGFTALLNFGVDEDPVTAL